MPGDASDRYDPDYGYKGPRKINKQDGSSSLPKAQPKKQRQQSAAPAVDPMAAFYDMMAGFAPPHQPSGPTQEEIDAQIEADRITQGGNDLQEAYGGYLTASEDATSFVNDQIAKERSNAALLGMDFVMTDEIKQGRISDQFATIFGADAWDQLQTLNTDFGDIDNPLEFLITRGAAGTADDKKDVSGNTQGAKVAKGGGTPDTSGTGSLLDPNFGKEPAFNALGV